MKWLSCNAKCQSDITLGEERLATVLVYLTTPVGGGETFFPLAGEYLTARSRRRFQNIA
jgi:hypothetical protein